MKMSSLGRWLLATAGVIAVALGVIGIFLPLLPTTPFLLLAAACFVRSSDRLYNWLINHKWFGAYIRNYRLYRAVTLRTKIVALVLLWGVMISSIVFVVDAWPLRLIMATIAACVTIHLIRMKTLTPEMLAGSETIEETQGNK